MCVCLVHKNPWQHTPHFLKRTVFKEVKRDKKKILNEKKDKPDNNAAYCRRRNLAVVKTMQHVKIQVLNTNIQTDLLFVLENP